MKTNCWPIFDVVVTDFSLALINSTCEAWNSMSTQTYLNTMYDIINHKSENVNLTNVHVKIKLCCAHLMKLMARDINNSFDDKSTATVLKEIIAAFFNIADFELLKLSIKNLFILLLHQFEIPLVETALQSLLVATETTAEVDTENVEKRVKSTGQTFYQNNKFYIHFKKVYDSIETQTHLKTHPKLHKTNIYLNQALHTIHSDVGKLIC